MRTTRIANALCLGLLAPVFWTVLAGCNAPKPIGPATGGMGNPKVLDQLVAAYPDDLGTKHFQVIADFEEPRQATLFHREPDKDAGAVGVSTARAQQNTGVGSLRISLLDAHQQVVAVESPQAEWALHQDWAPYNLLMMSVFSPRDQGGFRFSITSGVQTPLVYEHPRIFLKTGWNRIRIDLADIAERVYLGDIREMRFWCDPLDSPIELYIDDIILADNSRDLMPNAPKTSGSLSLKSVGRRLVVSAADRFELVFNRGQIRQWFDLANDPQRIHNLAGGGALGPVPVLIGQGGANTVYVDAPGQWSKLGPLAESYQTVVEASPMRVVIHGEWRFGQPDGAMDENSPYHRWVYSIYRSGEVCVELGGSIEEADTKEIGIVFGCDGNAGFGRSIKTADADNKSASVPYVLFSQPQQAGSADLLVVPSRPMVPQMLEDAHASRLCVMYRVPVEVGQFLFTGQLRVWPNDIDSAIQAEPMATAYAKPMPISVDTGSLLRTDPGDFDGDGFSEGRGYYVLQLDGRVAKVRLDGRDHMRFSPVFKLVDANEYDVWVYVDGRQIKDMHRDLNGNLLFEVPGVISREVLIEITASKKTAPSQ